MSAEILDLSQFNTVEDWQRVRDAGIVGVYVRALIGSDTLDTRLHEHANGARSVGLPFGVYGLVYPRHEAPQDAAEQGQQLAALHAEVGASLLPALDCENGPPGPPTDAEWREAVEDYAAAVSDCIGRDPIVYASPVWWLAHGLNWARIDDCPLWLADYRPSAPQVPAPWSSWTLHQYTGSGACDGITGRVDRSRLAEGLTIDAIRC